MASLYFILVERSDHFSSKNDYPPNWFEMGFVKKIGLDLQTSFWEESWIWIMPLKIRFQRVYTISQIQEGFVVRYEGGNMAGFLES